MEVKGLEKYLIEERGWALRQPYNESAVILMSGGIDSSVLAEMAINSLDTTLFPLYVRRGAHAEADELDATEHIVTYLQEKYPNRIHPLHTITADVPPAEIASKLVYDQIQARGIPLRNSILSSIAVQHAVTLNDEISTVIVCVEKVIPEGAEYPDMSLQTFLANSIMVCSNLGDWKWQIMSPLLIPGLVADTDYITKQDLVKWGQDYEFPLGKTYSCTRGGQPCGACRSCRSREKVLK